MKQLGDYSLSYVIITVHVSLVVPERLEKSKDIYIYNKGLVTAGKVLAILKQRGGGGGGRGCHKKFWDSFYAVA